MSRWMAIVAATALVVTACGGSATPPEPPSTSEPGTAPSSDATSTTPTTAGPGDDEASTGSDGEAGLPFELGAAGNSLDVETESNGEPISAVIGPDGGVVELTAADGTIFTLTVPADALAGSEEITMTPAVPAPGALPEADAALGVVLEPAGLVFRTPATLEVQAANPGDVFALGGSGSGTNLHPVPADAAPESVTLSVPHFSIYLVVTGGPQLEQLLAFHVPSGREAQALSLLSSIDRRFSDSEIGRRERDHVLQQWARGLADDAQRAIGADPVRLAGLIGEAMSLSMQLGGASEEVVTTFIGLRSMLSRALEQAARDASIRCISAGDPDEAFDILRWWSADVGLNMFTVPPSSANESVYRNLLEGCFRFDFVVEVESSGTAGDTSFEVEHLARIPMDSIARIAGPEGFFVDSSTGRFSFPQFVGPQEVTSFTLRPTPPAPCELAPHPGTLTVDVEGTLFDRNFNLQALVVGDRGVETLTVDLEWSPPPQTTIECGVGPVPPLPTWAPYFVKSENATFTGAVGDSLLISFGARVELDRVDDGDTYARKVLRSSFEGITQTTTIEIRHAPSG